MTLDIKQWLRANLTKKIRFGRDSREWDLIFDATCWFLWLYRNRLVYETDGVESWSVLAKVRHWFEYTDVGIQSLDGSNPVATTLVSAGQVPRPIARSTTAHWCPPPEGWIKLNTDGLGGRGNGKEAFEILRVGSSSLHGCALAHYFLKL
ncbi:hypothetical protein V6N12_035675 [Hibiscus sabdariffa]|uniref:Uncharacterized protein n=1 Tax=Hibiscus sabdariffa TaxID=183260 RepID=A0ABR2ENF5_9ROSI